MNLKESSLNSFGLNPSWAGQMKAEASCAAAHLRPPCQVVGLICQMQMSCLEQETVGHERPCLRYRTGSGCHRMTRRVSLCHWTAICFLYTHLTRRHQRVRRRMIATIHEAPNLVQNQMDPAQSQRSEWRNYFLQSARPVSFLVLSHERKCVHPQEFE